MVVDHLVAGQPVEPGRKGPATLFVAVDGLPGLEEDAACDVLGLQAVADIAAGVALDRFGV